MHALTLTDRRRDGLEVIEIAFGDTASPDARDELVVAGTEAVITALVAASGTATQGIALDIRTPDAATADAASAHRAAFIEACHGLVHAYVAEERTAIVPVNIVVSSDSQRADRDTTLDFLASADGEYTRGVLIDLRDAA